MSNSKTVECPYCRQPIHEYAVKCHWCNSDTSAMAEQNRKNNKGGWLYFIIILVIVGGIKSCFGCDDEKTSETNVRTEQTTNNTTTEETPEPTAEYTKEEETPTLQETHIEISNSGYTEDSKEIEQSEQNMTQEEIVLQEFELQATALEKIKFNKKAAETYIQQIAIYKGEPYYSKIIDFVVKTNKSLSKEWAKNGEYFENKIEFYESYISDYKQILKDKTER
ncbi:MAG: hypothetical protein LBN27_09785 [Prevotellaceae bacterium]|jgi:hypothetical protein|nr:hypothetical protein [Prevotellaceae bacterium]